MTLYGRCRTYLAHEVRAFWDDRRCAVAQGIGGAGKLEKFFRLFRKYMLPLVHPRSRVERLFRARDRRARRQFYDAEWNQRRWRWMARVFFSRTVIGRLGRDVQSLEDFIEIPEASDLCGFNLSDIFEYMSEANAHRLLEKLAACGRKGARLVYWNLLALFLSLIEAAAGRGTDNFFIPITGCLLLKLYANYPASRLLLHFAIGPFGKSEFDRLCRGPGQAGEIVVSGAHVLKGYLHGEGNRDTKFSVEGRTWHRTGDAGCVDPQGNLWLLGRCAGRISDQQGVLYPFTVETAADSLAAVRRSALVRVDGRRTLVVEPAAGSTAAELERLTSKLAWAQIERLLVLPRIPVDRRHNSKVDYPGLARMMKRPERIPLQPAAGEFAVRTR